MEIYIIVILLIVISIFLIVIMGAENFPFYGWYSTKQKEYEKMQWVRLLDILVLGPFAIWLANKLQKDETKKWGIIPYLLYTYGFCTIVYNFINFYQNIYR